MRDARTKKVIPRKEAYLHSQMQSYSQDVRITLPEDVARKLTLSLQDIINS